MSSWWEYTQYGSAYKNPKGVVIYFGVFMSGFIFVWLHYIYHFSLEIAFVSGVLFGVVYEILFYLYLLKFEKKS